MVQEITSGLTSEKAFGRLAGMVVEVAQTGPMRAMKGAAFAVERLKGFGGR